MDTPEALTGALFGSLWTKLSDQQFKESVDLFNKRFEANGFDLRWFDGKQCLDVGTGSGRYALAMAMHGAKVSACDISETGIAEAKRRTADFVDIDFKIASALDLPYPDAAFDFVCCAGVLHHTPSIERGLDEIARVLKPGGKMFILLYGAEGVRWMMIKALRPFAAEFGYDTVDTSIGNAGFPANNRKHFLDDLFVPILTQTSWPILNGWLSDRGFTDIARWKKGQEYDHEANGMAIMEDMRKLDRIFFGVHDSPFANIAKRMSNDFIACAQDFGWERDDATMVGEGLHRVIAVKRLY